MAASEAMRLARGEPGEDNGFQVASARLILASHLRLLQRPLLPAEGDGDAAWRL